MTNWQIVVICGGLVFVTCIVYLHAAEFSSVLWSLINAKVSAVYLASLGLWVFVSQYAQVLSLLHHSCLAFKRKLNAYS